MKMLLELSDRIVADIESERVLYLNQSSLSRSGMIRMLLKEALAIRVLVPDSLKDMEALRNRYDTYLKETTTNLRVNLEDPAAPLTQKTGGFLRVPKMNRTTGRIPGSVSMLLEAVEQLGKIASKREIMELLCIEENSAGQRIKKALKAGLLFRILNGVYGLSTIIEGEEEGDEVLFTDEEFTAFDRARRSLRRSPLV